MGPCWVSTSSQSYPLCASCSATVGLCAFRNSPILGCPARSCFLNSDPLRAASGIRFLLGMDCVVYRMGRLWSLLRRNFCADDLRTQSLEIQKRHLRQLHRFGALSCTE